MFNIFNNIDDLSKFENIKIDNIFMKIDGRKLDKINKFISIYLYTDTSDNLIKNTSVIFQQIKDKFIKKLYFKKNVISQNIPINKNYYIKNIIEDNKEWNTLDIVYSSIITNIITGNKYINSLNSIGYNININPTIENIFINPNKKSEIINLNSEIIYSEIYTLYNNIEFTFSEYKKSNFIIKNEICIKIYRDYKNNLNIIENFIIDNSYFDTFNYLYQLSTENKYNIMNSLFSKDDQNNYTYLKNKITTCGTYFNNFLPQLIDHNPNLDINCYTDNRFIKFYRNKNDIRSIFLFVYSKNILDRIVIINNNNLFFDTNIEIENIRYALEGYITENNKYYFNDILIYDYKYLLKENFIDRYNILKDNLPTIYADGKVNTIIDKFDLTKSYNIYNKSNSYIQTQIFKYQPLNEIEFNSLAIKSNVKNTYILYFMISKELLDTYPINLQGYMDRISNIPFIFPFNSKNIKFDNKIYSTEDLHKKIVKIKYINNKPEVIKIDINRTTEFIKNNNMFSMDPYKLVLNVFYRYIIGNKKIVDINYNSLKNIIYNWSINMVKTNILLSFDDFIYKTDYYNKLYSILYNIDIYKSINIFNTYTNFHSKDIGKLKLYFYDYDNYNQIIHKANEDLLVNKIDTIIINSIEQLNKILEYKELFRSICKDITYIIGIFDNIENINKLVTPYNIVNLNTITTNKDFAQYYGFGKKIKLSGFFDDELKNFNNKKLFIGSIW